jgi:hypothetical protein
VVGGHFKETWVETHSTRPRCGSLVFAAIYSDLFRCRLASVDIYSVGDSTTCASISSTSLHVSSPPFRSARRADGTEGCAPQAVRVPPFLPLLRFARVVPLRRFSRCVASPSVLPHLWRDGASRFRTVRSRGCSHLSGFSHTPVPDVLQSSPTMGFATFPLVVDRVGELAEASSPLGPRRVSPTARFVPLEAFPSSVAVPHSCGRCPLDVTATPPSHCSSGASAFEAPNRPKPASFTPRPDDRCAV